jgi:hypothetical protein
LEDCSGREDRLQLLLNVDTLSKSKKDAEEERKEGLDPTTKGRRGALE